MNTMIKKTLVIAALMTSQLASAAVVVIDPTAIARLADQINQMKQQYSLMQQSFKSISGTRGMENIANDPKRTQYLPKDYQTVLNGGVGDPATVRAAYKKFGVEENKVAIPKDYVDHFNNSAKKSAANYAAMDSAYTAVNKRFEDMDKLLTQLKVTKDAKDVADLQARITAEQTILQVEGNRIQLLNNLAQAEQRLQDQQAKELNMKAANGSIPKY